MSTYREKYFELTKNYHEIFTNEVVFSLFCDNFGCSKNEIYFHLDENIKDEIKLDKYINEIKLGKPYQYVLGHTEFLSNKFIVNENVLIPRQETEQLVIDTASLIKEKFNHKVDILDMCSGSGVIGISLAKKIESNVDLVDISSKCQEVAEQNALLNKTKVGIFVSDLFKELPLKKYDVIISNPPYIKDSSTVHPSTFKYEPHLALFASPTTFFYEEIFKNKDLYLKDHFLLAFEIGEDMEIELTRLIKKYFPTATYFFKKDMYNCVRFLYIEA